MVQQGCARGASLEDMAWRAASFVLNEPGSRHLTPPPSRTLFPVCPSRAGHGEREPATWGAEPPLLRTNLQARAARGRPAVKAPDAGTDSTTRHSPRVPSTRNGPGAPQSLSAAAGAGAWGGPITADRGRLALRAPSTRGVGSADVVPARRSGRLPRGPAPACPRARGCTQLWGRRRAWAGHAAFHTPEDREPHVAVTVALGGIAGSGRARGVRRPSGVAGIGVCTLHGGRPSPTGRGGGDAPLTAAPLVPRSSSSSR